MPGAGGDAALDEERTPEEMTIVVRMTRMVIRKVSDGKLGSGGGEGKVQRGGGAGIERRAAGDHQEWQAGCDGDCDGRVGEAAEAEAVVGGVPAQFSLARIGLEDSQAK